MSDNSLRNLNISQLQQLAAAEATRYRAKALPRTARAARLYLIQMLSQSAGVGLTLLAAATVLTAALSLATPMRALIWLTMTAGAFWVSRKLLLGFRVGDEPASRPFRWRADYTASLVVLGAAFGAGAFMLAPMGAPLFKVMLVSSLIGLGAFCAATAHFAHAPAAIALMAPPMGFVMLSALRAPETVMMAGGVLGFAAVAMGAILVFSHRIARKARLRHPADPFLAAAGVVDAAPTRAETNEDETDVKTTAKSRHAA